MKYGGRILAGSAVFILIGLLINHSWFESFYQSLNYSCKFLTTDPEQMLQVIEEEYAKDK